MAALVVPATIALGLSVQRSVNSPMWRDEFATSAHAALDVPDLLDAVSRVDAVFGPYYLLMHSLGPVLGDGVWLRLPSIVAFVLATVLVGVIARRWWGALPAFGAGMLFAVNDLLIGQAANARPYTLSVMALLAAVLALDAAMNESAMKGSSRGRWAWIAASIAGALAVAMHLFAVIPLATTALLLLGRPRAIGAWALSLAPSAAIAALLSVASLGHHSQLAWLSAPGFREVILILASVAGVTTGRRVALDAVLLAVLFAVTLLVLVLGGRSATPDIDADGLGEGRWDHRRPVVFSCALLLAPWLVLAVGSWLITPMLISRYLVWSVAGAAFLIGAGLHVWVRLRTPAATVAGVASVALLAVSGVLALERAVRDESRPGALEQVSDHLAGAAEPGDRIALVQHYWEGGVASEFAAAADDASYASEVIARLPRGGQPFMEVRRIVSVDPLRTELDQTAPAAGDVVWLLTISPVTDEDLETLDPQLADCLDDLAHERAVEIDAFDLTRVTCDGP